jgi:hypothetical protein
MDIRDIIREDHDEALQMIEKLEKVAEKPATEETMLMTRKLVAAVKLHARSEEVGLYAALETAKKELRDFSLEGYNEHECLELMLNKLAGLEPGEDGEYKAALMVVKELIEHHGKEEEEREIFPKLGKAFSADELMGFGALMMEEKERLREGLEPSGDEPTVRQRPPRKAQKQNGLTPRA